MPSVSRISRPPKMKFKAESDTGDAVNRNKKSSCLACRTNKRSCDGGRPCARCAKRGIPCVDVLDRRTREFKIATNGSGKGSKRSKAAVVTGMTATSSNESVLLTSVGARQAAEAA